MEENITAAQPTAETEASAVQSEKGGKKFVKRIPRKKVCAFCQAKA